MALDPAFVAAILEMPSLDVPEGITPNFDNPPGGNRKLGYSVIILSAIISTFAVIIRISSRLVLKRVNIEDGLLVAALVGQWEYNCRGAAVADCNYSGHLCWRDICWHRCSYLSRNPSPSVECPGEAHVKISLCKLTLVSLSPLVAKLTSRSKHISHPFSMDLLLCVSKWRYFSTGSGYFYPNLSAGAMSFSGCYTF